MCFYVSDLPLEMYETDTKYTFKKVYMSLKPVFYLGITVQSIKEERGCTVRENMRE